MQAFSYWHAYFDSAFLASPLKIKNALYQDLHIDSHIRPWVHLDELPQLPRILESLQRYILTETNWMGCLLSETQMQEIQQKLNSLLINLQCEKKYAQQFWLSTPRRIQASVIHFYLFFKMMIEACIPRDCENILQANDKDKLIIFIPQLQNLVNEILKAFKPIYSFMCRPEFREESQFTSEMFKEWTNLLKTLPQIKKSMLLTVPKLLEYICIVNPLETNQMSPEFSPTTVSIRSRNITQIQKPKHHKPTEKSQEKRRNSHLRKNKIDLRSKDLKRSVEWYRPESPIKNTSEKLVMFKFKQKVRKYSVYLSKKKTIGSIQTKDRSGTQLSRSPHSQLNYSIFQNPPKPQRTGTLAESRLCNSICIERRSRQSKSKTMFLSKNSNIICKRYQDDDIQQERDEKRYKYKKKIPLRVFNIDNISHQMNISDGKPRGWGFIREWFKQRLAARKLQMLLCD